MKEDSKKAMIFGALATTVGTAVTQVTSTDPNLVDAAMSAIITFPAAAAMAYGLGKLVEDRLKCSDETTEFINALNNQETREQLLLVLPADIKTGINGCKFNNIEEGSVPALPGDPKHGTKKYCKMCTSFGGHVIGSGNKSKCLLNNSLKEAGIKTMNE